MRVGLIAPASPFLLDQAVHGPLGLWSLGAAVCEHPERYDLSVDTVGGWYKGTPGEYTVGHRTAALSANDLRVARDYLEARFKRWQE